MKSIRMRSYLTIVQIIVMLCLIAGLIFYQRDWVIGFFQTTQTGQMGLILNGSILLLFLFGLFRIILVLLSYAREQGALLQFIERMRDKVANPTYNMSQNSLIVDRFLAIKQISEQHAEVDQGALAATLAASQGARFTLIRFVHNTLILAGVFGTIVSLSVALVGAAGLLDSPDSLEKMGTIIGGMSTALSTTITAIICYVFYTYYHLRLQDIRTQLLANLEDVTSRYIMPQFRTVEGNLMHDVSVLTGELRMAAESITQIQNRFLQAGDRLQLAVDDLQNSIGSGSRDIRIIRDSLREGFRLSEGKSSRDEGERL
ncbi:MAG: hypothetical protein ACPGSM_04860 [Thiolinea sp.]